MRAVLFTALVLFLATVSYGLTAKAQKLALPVFEQETDFVITVKARDAMFIGTAAGGARITMTDRRTGDIIAAGTVSGGMGAQDTVMKDMQARGAVIVDENTAKIQFSVGFWEPTPVTITATAPLGQLQSTVSVSEDMIIIPGKDYTTGNGIMLELPGFAVKALEPAPNSVIAHDPNGVIAIKANVMKLCGCLVAEDTPWSPDRYQVEAWVYKDNLFVTSVEVPYSGEPGIFGTNFKIPLPGTSRVLVTAYDPVTKEAGMDATTIILAENEDAQNADNEE